MKPIYLLLTLAFAVAVLISSCDSVYTYEYYVANNADTTVEVHFRMQENLRDTMVMVPVGGVQLICKPSHGVEGIKGPFFRDVDRDLDTLYVVKKGVASHRNYRNNDAWQFSKQKPAGIYTAGVTNGEF